MQKTFPYPTLSKQMAIKSICPGDPLYVTKFCMLTCQPHATAINQWWIAALWFLSLLVYKSLLQPPQTMSSSSKHHINPNQQRVDVEKLKTRYYALTSSEANKFNI